MQTRLICDYCIIFAFHTADKEPYNRLEGVTLQLTLRMKDSLCCVHIWKFHDVI